MSDEQVLSLIREVLESDVYQDCTVKHQAFQLLDLMKWIDKQGGLIK